MLKFRPILANNKLLIASAVFFISLALFLWEIVDWLATPAHPSIMARPPHNIKPVPSNDFSCVNTPLFGKYAPTQLATKMQSSLLDITVVGILFAPITAQSQVIISTHNGQQETYTVGDTLPGGSIIKRIAKNTVLVAHNGKLARLNLPKKEKNVYAD